ncbi:SURF1 family protein [Sphingobium amiense]|uniref:SURF1-like protein n=1 Tax=Sphingobium amiense TaxID=135719 RepID=A0A494VXI9_9SPHN|nr:SURF1 family protein [Sphingobium amiense]BBD97103.1 SURF1 family protein [Sphingobium amiense]
MTAGEAGGRRRRSAAFLIGITSIALLLVAGFSALGVWQVQRLRWKRDLIARVESRVHAAPLPAPVSATADDEYRRVAVSGAFLHDRAALVQASTVRGAGYWVLTPLRRDDGGILFVNRGFVPGRKADYARPTGHVRIVGLLRLNEPGGGFLRGNDPAADRWYSRDVDAIARSRRIAAANYFVDAEAGPSPDALPVGGLTVLRFANNHLQYAITWFALAVMSLFAYILAMRLPEKDREP